MSQPGPRPPPPPFTHTHTHKGRRRPQAALHQPMAVGGRLTPVGPRLAMVIGPPSTVLWPRRRGARPVVGGTFGHRVLSHRTHAPPPPRAEGSARAFQRHSVTSVPSPWTAVLLPVHMPASRPQPIGVLAPLAAARAAPLRRRAVASRHCSRVLQVMQSSSLWRCCCTSVRCSNSTSARRRPSFGMPRQALLRRPRVTRRTEGGGSGTHEAHGEGGGGGGAPRTRHTGVWRGFFW